MEKYLGLEYEDLAEREQFIKDNADSIENMGYTKPIPSDQIEKLKETLADASIKKLEQEEAKKAAVQMYNEEIKGYKLTIKDAARQAQEQIDIRKGALLQAHRPADKTGRLLHQGGYAGLPASSTPR